MTAEESMSRVFGDHATAKSVIEENRGAEHPNLDMATTAHLDRVIDAVKRAMVASDCTHGQITVVLAELRRAL